MAIYQVKAPDGNIIKLEGPDGASEEDIISQAQVLYTPKETKEPKERTYGEVGLDVVGPLIKGVGNLAALPSQLGQLAGYEGLPLQETSKNIQNYGESLKSETYKQKEKNVNALIEAAAEKGVLEQAIVAFKETGSDPTLFAGFLAEMLPNLIPGTAVGKGLRLAGAGAKTVLGGALGTNAVIQGADVGSQNYEDTYKYLLSKGVSEPEAKQEALSIARKVAVGAGGVSLGAQFLPGARNLEKSLLGMKGTSGRLAGAVGTGLGELGSEMVEEGGGKLLSNYGMQQVNPEQSLTEGLGQTLGMSALGGFGLGTVGGALRGRIETPEELSKDKALNNVLGDLRTSFGTSDAVSQPDLVKKMEAYGLNSREAENFIANQAQAGNLNMVVKGDVPYYQIPEANLDEKKQEAVQAPENYAPEFIEAAAQLNKTLLPQLNKFGLKNVGLNILDSIEGGRADGYYANKIIGVALNADNPMGVLRHESIHALRAFEAFKPQEWNVLENKAKGEWVDKFIKNSDKEKDLYEGYKQQYLQDKGNLEGFEDYIHEEAIAEAFKYFDKNGAPPGAIGNIYYRLKQLFETLRNGFTGIGFDTTDKIFNRVEQGKMAPQEAGTDNTKYALNKKPYGIPQNIWDLHNKSVAAEETARRYNYGSAKRNQTMAFRRLNNAVNAEFGENQALPVLQKLSKITSIEQAVKENDESALNNYKVAFPEEYNQVVNKSKESDNTKYAIKPDLTTKEGVIQDAINKYATAIDKHLSNYDQPIGSASASSYNALEKIQDNIEKRLETLGVQTRGASGKPFDSELREIFDKQIAPAARQKAKEIKEKRQAVNKPKNYSLTGKDNGKTGKDNGKGYLTKSAETEIEQLGTEAGGIPRRRELPRSERGIPSSGTALAETQSLKDLPSRVNIPGLGVVEFGAHPEAKRAANEYMDGKSYFPPTSYKKVNPEKAKRIAQAYEEMIHEPNNPDVKASYEALAKETLAQWEAIKKTGLKVEFLTEDMEDPYRVSPRLSILDVIHNNHLWVFPTDFGYGTETIQDDGTNPLLRFTDEIISGKRARVNDIFRIVHDYFGHVKDGNGFRADGEENAWRAHSAMYSPLARKAMTAETRGQNSWVNYGPYAEFNKTASAADTKYAPQKLGLLPDEFIQSGSAYETDYNPSISIVNGDLKPDLKGKVTVDKVAQYFDSLHEAPLDFNNSKNFERAINYASDEIKDQLKQEKAGLDWYEEDIKAAFASTMKVIPELQSEQKRQLFAVVAGIQSPSTNARDNWVIASEAFQHYIKTGTMPSVNPKTGKLWQGGTVSANKKKQLNLLNNFLQDFKEDKAVEWLYSEHKVSEINEFRKKYGSLGKINGKQNDTVPGLYMFGPKIGPFVGNINGIHDVTVDMWMTRTFNRYFGKMADNNGSIIDKPTEPERVVIKQFVNEVAKNAGIKPYQAQSVLWFYEQRLFRSLGTPSASYGFSDGGRKFLEQSISARDGSGKEGVRSIKQKKSYSLRRYGAVSGEPISFNAKQPAAQTYVGVHYSNAEREYLSGNKSGTGIKGAEEKRLKYTKDLRIKKRVYFYIPKTQTEAYPNKEAGLGVFKHFQSFDNILGPGKEMARLYNESGAKEDNDFNLFESAIVNAGYDGYAAPDMGMMVILNQDSIPVNFDDTDKKFSLALGKVEPATFLVSDKEPNNTGNLAYMSTASTLPHRPIRLPVGTHDDISDRGFGANHILRRIEQKPSRRPPIVSREVLEDVILQVQNIGKNFTRIYRDGNNKFVLFNPLTNDQLIVAQRPDHYEVVTMYQAKGVPTTIGNPVWSGRNIQPPPAKEYLEKQRGISVRAGERGVTPNAIAVQVKKRRVISPQDIENSANETKKMSLKVREFSMDDLPTGTNRPIFVLKKGTAIYHGAHKAVAEQIKESNSLHAKPKTKSGGGILTEGDLIWFGDKELAEGHSKSDVDVFKVSLEEKEGRLRKKGQVFSAITDKDYKLVPRGKILTKAEVDKLNSFLKLPNYEKLNVGDRLSSAEYRAHRFSDSNTNRYYIENAGTMSNSLAQAVRALGYDGVYDSSGIALTAENGIRLGDSETPMQRYSLKAPQTPEFKRWFGSSKIVNADGSPKVMYHGTARDIDTFKPKQANAIFVTSSPKFAESFADSSENYIKNNDIKEAWKNLTNIEQYDLQTKSLKQAKKDGVVNAARAREIQEGLSKDIQVSLGLVAGELEDYISSDLGLNIDAYQNIMPLFIKSENPFDYENARQVENLIAKLNEPKYNKFLNENERRYGSKIVNEIKRGKWDTIENERVQDAIKALGHDGFYVQEGGYKNLAVYDSSQLKSATGNRGTFDITSPNIRYSLPSPLKKLTKLEESKSAYAATTDAMQTAFKQVQSNELWTSVRGNLVDPAAWLTKSLSTEQKVNGKTVEGLDRFDVKGKLRADMLVRINSQMGNFVKNGMLSGVPVLNKDGGLMIERTESNLARALYLADKLDNNPNVKALGISGRFLAAEVGRIKRGEEILKEDAKSQAEGKKKSAEAIVAMKEARKLYKQNKIREANAKVKEARDLRKEAFKLKKQNRELQVTPAHIAWANKQLVKVPELNQIFNVWNDVNNSLVDFWEEVGLLDEKKANEYRSNKSYLPLYKSLEELNEEGFFSGTGTGLKSTKSIKHLKGSESIRNIWENMDRHYASMTSMGFQNQIRRVAVEQLEGLGLARVVKNNDPDANLRYKENGKVVSAVVDNPNDLTAFEMMHFELSPLANLFSGSTKVLRAGALINPYYWFKQLIVDPIHATFVTNAGVVYPFHSMKAFAEILIGKSKDAEMLASRGVGGSVDSLMDINEFMKQSGRERVDQSFIKKPISAIMRIHEASDSATRVAIFRKALKTAKKKGFKGEDAINFAVHTSREAINFSVHGKSRLVTEMRHMIPFFSSTINSLDTVYRAARGVGLNKKEAAEARRIFYGSAMATTMMAVVYAMLLAGDPEYEDLTDQEKYNNLLMPNPLGKGFIRLPIPYEIGFLFKVIPEASFRYIYGTSTGKEWGTAMKVGVLQNIPSGGIPVPQAIKPILENYTNRSFHTGFPVEGMGDQGLPISMRGERASEFSKVLSKAGLDKIGLSPANIDNIAKGYFANLGMYALDLMDQAIYKLEGKTPPARELESIPIIKRFITDPNVSKAVQDFYKLEHNSRETMNEFNRYKETGNAEMIQELVNNPEKLANYGGASALRGLGKELTTINKAIRYYQDNEESGTPQERRERINELKQVKIQIAKAGYEVAKGTGMSR